LKQLLAALHLAGSWGLSLSIGPAGWFRSRSKVRASNVVDPAARAWKFHGRGYCADEY